MFGSQFQIESSAEMKRYIEACQIIYLMLQYTFSSLGTRFETANQIFFKTWRADLYSNGSRGRLIGVLTLLFNPIMYRHKWKNSAYVLEQYYFLFLPVLKKNRCMYTTSGRIQIWPVSKVKPRVWCIQITNMVFTIWAYIERRPLVVVHRFIFIDRLFQIENIICYPNYMSIKTGNTMCTLWFWMTEDTLAFLMNFTNIVIFTNIRLSLVSIYFRTAIIIQESTFSSFINQVCFAHLRSTHVTQYTAYI
jgi:hypothetical protein